MKILICGLPGSGKSTLAEPLSVVLDAVWLNADADMHDISATKIRAKMRDEGTLTKRKQKEK